MPDFQTNQETKGVQITHLPIYETPKHTTEAFSYLTPNPQEAGEKVGASIRRSQ